MANIPTVIFSYRVDDILEEITKRTSKLGQMRTAEGPSLVDRLSLTRGEDFMFSEFLEDAVSQTYDWLKAFGRKIPMYEKIVLKYEDIKLYKNNGYKLTVGGQEIEAGVSIPVNVSSYDVLTSGIQQELYITFPNIAAEKKGGDSDAAVIGELSYTLHFDEIGLGENNVFQESGKVILETLEGVDDVTIKTNAFLRGTLTKIELELLITITESVKPIAHNTYVEYHTDFDNDSVFDVYQTNVNCTTANWKDYSCKLAIDPRDKIVFILENSCNMDMNLMSSIDRNIKEALVNYIIWRWFEYTNPQEADRFYVKFEAYASEAKNGMDSEREIMQRTYNINR